MKGIRDLFGYFKNYMSYVLAAIGSNILMAIFTVFSIPLIIPFFQILFQKTPEIPVKPDNITDVIGHLNYYFSDLILSLDKKEALLYVCAFIAIVFFFKNLFRYLALFFLAPARNGIIRDLRNQIMAKYMDLPLSFYSDERRGDLLSRISADVQEVEASVLNVIEAIFKAPLIIAGSLIFMIYISPQLTLFVFVLLIVTVFIIGGVSKTLKKQSHAAQKSLGDIISIAEESISSMRIIKGFNAEETQKKKFDVVNNQYRHRLTRIFWRRDLSSPLSEFLGIVVVTILLYYGSTLVFDNKLEPETFFAFIFAFYQVIEPSKLFSSAYYNIQKGMAALERIQVILTNENEIKKDSGSQLKETFDNTLEIKNLSFKFPNSDIAVLDDVTLTIKKGEHLALVGSSGSGKTTLVNLLPRFYNITNGEILIDGQSIKEFDIKSLRNLFGIVSQEPILFHDTIKNNISFGMSDKSDEEIIEAAKIANAHTFIQGLDDGYDTVVGDKGSKLSGGQRQRITIARAILKDPAILILDEATSALDAESENLVKEALEKAMLNRTVITIAHKFSTIQNADKIIVMKHGKIIQEGKHEDLMKLGGEYLTNLELQRI
ncbi:ABC transporter ATP-binding protein [Portibacter lacus]|uniref:Antibiotic ABC transporter ATP-binding protein n=1 Tax=Portibacter lacus TaxID=1099794 RepID=A0AA37WFV3_9BACT|nr:ABC transporter ATP-binding protein [Portibacter lacus]GLR19168.1 antibiotic ABC transporter ATP-binding protein [Portibacter lacus]